MSVDELDLYDDLDDFQQAEEAKSKELQSWEAKCTAAQVEIDNLQVQNKALAKKIKIMEINFQNLLDTAKAEIKRKDSLITQLRKEKDDLCFRRKRGTKFEPPESNLLNGTAHQEHKRFKKDEIETEAVPEVSHRSDKRREENVVDKHKSARNEQVQRKHETHRDKSNDYKRDKQQSSDTTSSRHRSTEDRRTHDRERDRNRRRSRSRDRDRYRNRETNRESSNSRKPHANSKEMQKRRRSRSRSNQRGSAKFSNHTNSQERDGKLDTPLATTETTNVKQQTLEALFGNTPKSNSPAEQTPSSNSSVDSAKVLKKLQANVESFTPQELYTPENLPQVDASLIKDIEIRQDLTVEIGSYFVSNVEQVVEVLETDIQVPTIDVKTADIIPGLDLIENEETTDEQTHMLQYNLVSNDKVDLKLIKSDAEHMEIEEQTTNDRLELEVEAEVLVNMEYTESKSAVIEAKLTESDPEPINEANNVVKQIIQDFSDIEHTIGSKSFKEKVKETQLTETVPKNHQAIHEANNEVDQIIQDISEIERKDAIEKFAKFPTTQSSEPISNCLKFDVSSAHIVVENKQQTEGANTITKREDIQIIEDIRLPVMMDIEDIVLQVDVEGEVQVNQDTAHIQDIVLNEAERPVETLLNVQLGKDMVAPAKDHLTHETAFAVDPIVATEIEHPFVQATTGEESDQNSQVETIDTTLISKQTVMYAQPDSTKIDHNENDLAHKVAATQLTPAKVVLADINESYQNVTLETDTIDLELEQLHQHSHNDVQPDETVVTSTSMKTAQTPKKDLISILTQSPMQQTTAIVVCHTPPKTNVRAKKSSARTTSEKKTPNSGTSTDTTPERREKTPLKKRKLNLTDKHKHIEEAAQTTPSAGITMTTSPLDAAINDTLNSSSQELNRSFGSDTSIVTKRCSLGNSDYQFERVNDEIILRVTRRGRRRRPPAPVDEKVT